MNKHFPVKKPYVKKKVGMPVDSFVLVKEVDSLFNNYIQQRIIHSFKFLNVKPYKDVLDFVWVYFPKKNMRVEIRITFDDKVNKEFFREVVRKSRILILKIGSFLCIEKIAEAIQIFVDMVVKGLTGEQRVKSCLAERTSTDGEVLDFLPAVNSEDKIGIDGHLIYTNDLEQTNIVVPLQIKSSEKYQKIHIKLHPKIPSIRINCSNEIIISKLLRIAKAYRKKMVIHI